jgi:hypothetical protein
MTHKKKVELANDIYEVYKKGMCEWEDAFEIVEMILEKTNNKELQHHKDTTIGLYCTDKEPNKLFEIVMNTIDGDPFLSAIDYEYYKKIFDTKLSELIFRI